MILTDMVYGECQIREHVLIDLINSRAVQRLKGIAQFGVPDEWYHLRGFPRFEHSVGVLILLDRLQADLKEKIAGILHDISHTTFSHVIDYVYGTHVNEDFQDRTLAKFIGSPEIKSILQKYYFKAEDFYDFGKFTLLEQEIPDLCVDRIDYCLRELKMKGLDSEVQKCVDSLVNIDGRVYMNSKESALLFAKEFMKLQTEHWAGDQAKNRFGTLANILKVAIKEKIVAFEDFLTEDRFVMEKLKNSNNPEILKNIEKLVTGKFDNQDVTKKLRYVDPLYIESGVVKRLSKTDKEFLNIINSLKSS
jgi:hypothetical protein